jgi:hypothetical protein
VGCRQALVASAVISTFTLRPTSTPPVSSAAFQVMPNSSRSISVVAVKAMTSWPHGLRARPSNSTASSTSRVTPRIVSSPARTKSEPEWLTTLVLRNVISGWFSRSRKSPLRRCLSRSGEPVVMLPAPMVTSTDDCNGSSAIVMTPLTSVNEPRTLLTIRCLATKPTVLWAASRVNAPGSGMVIPSKLRPAMVGVVMVVVPPAPCGMSLLVTTSRWTIIPRSSMCTLTV